MAITYNSFPSLLFSSYTRDNAPAELPFGALSVADRDYMARSRSFQELLPTMAIMNSLGKEPSNYFLNERQFQAVEHDNKFRNQHFTNFLNKTHQLKYGIITFGQGGQYAYVILDAEMARAAKGVTGTYFATCLLIKDMVIGFEESVIHSGQLQPIPGGLYNNNMDIGGYLSFTAIALSFLTGANLPAPDNRTTEKIFTKK